MKMSRGQDAALARAVNGRARVEDALGQVRNCRASLGRSIAAALSAGVPAGLLAEKVGYTPARIYQLAKMADDQ